MRMRREELLAWLAVVIGIPPIVYLVKDGKWAAGVFTFLMFASLIGEFARIKWASKQPTLTLLRVKKRIEIVDEDAALARFEGTYEIMAHNRATEFSVSHGDGDGKIANIKINGQPVTPPDEVKTIGPKRQIIKRFSPELSPGTRTTLVITYDQIDAYPGQHKEGLSHRVSFKTKRFEVEVLFNEQRPCISARMNRRYMGSSIKLKEPHRQDNGLKTWQEIPSPPFGSEYTLEWDW